jgi:hypothetical protein
VAVGLATAWVRVPKKKHEPPRRKFMAKILSDEFRCEAVRIALTEERELQKIVFFAAQNN